jgi:apolipoprotein N-acyltransferase
MLNERFKSKRWALIFKFIFGLGVALGLPPLSLYPIALICLSLVLILEFGEHSFLRRRHFSSGLVFGFGYFLFAFHWIGFAFLVDASNYLWMMPFAVVGLALFMACYWGVAFVVAHALAKRGVVLWLGLPCCLAVMEFLRGYLFTGFPWAVPGLMADGMGGVLQLASVVGMPGLTLLILVWGMLPAWIFMSRKTGVAVLMLPILLLATLPMGWAWGEFRLHNNQYTDETAPLIRLVQPNISQSDKWRSENAKVIFNTLLALTGAASEVKPTVIIWPESAVSFLLDESEIAKTEIANALQPGQTLLTGAIRRQVSGTDERYFTSVLNMDDSGVVTAVYDKWRLVPGGEYLPFAWALEPLGFRKVVNLPESFSEGSGPQAIDVPGVGLAVMLICYEAIFPHQLVPESKRARWIVNVTNDGWFGQSVGPYQHFAQVRMRAVEQGLPVARAANTGISAVIDAFGRVIAKIDLGEHGYLDAQMPAQAEETFFASWGMMPASLMLFLLLVLATARCARPNSDN